MFEKCIVGTGLECQVALDSGALAIAEHEEKIISNNLTQPNKYVWWNQIYFDFK